MPIALTRPVSESLAQCELTYMARATDRDRFWRAGSTMPTSRR